VPEAGKDFRAVGVKLTGRLKKIDRFFEAAFFQKLVASAIIFAVEVIDHVALAFRNRQGLRLSK
jgi:hypothetical protein